MRGGDILSERQLEVVNLSERWFIHMRGGPDLCGQKADMMYYLKGSQKWLIYLRGGQSQPVWTES